MNVTCAAVSKWERGETYPDITLLQPLAYFFEVTLDELMGYDQKKVQADIDETIAHRKHWKDSKGREIIGRRIMIIRTTIGSCITICGISER